VYSSAIRSDTQWYFDVAYLYAFYIKSIQKASNLFTLSSSSSFFFVDHNSHAMSNFVWCLSFINSTILQISSLDLESIYVKFYLTKLIKNILGNLIFTLGLCQLTLLHNFHIAQLLLAKVKTHELQEMTTFLDQLPKRGNSNEQQRHEHCKYIKSIVVRETTLDYISEVLPIRCNDFLIYLFLQIVLHVSSGSIPHHQEHKTVHTASGIVNL
jgi:hypothetical protein